MQGVRYHGRISCSDCEVSEDGYDCLEFGTNDGVFGDAGHPGYETEREAREAVEQLFLKEFNEDMAVPFYSWAQRVWVSK